jgi:hypothetical protein
MHNIRGDGALTGRMRNSSTANASNVTTKERNTSLLKDIVALLRLPESLVDLRYSTLESRELDHGVGDLAAPEREQSLVEAKDIVVSIPVVQ